MSTLSLNSIANVVINVSPLAAPRSTFNQLLVLGDSSTSLTKEDRVHQYDQDFAEEMVADGFSVNDPEYIAMSLYFNQSPAPTSGFVGFKDSDESWLDAMMACREKNSEWYVGVALGAENEDHLELALWAETAEPSTVYAMTTDSQSVLEGDPYVVSPPSGSIALLLKELGFKRTIMQYSTEQEGQNPYYKYAICAIMGYAMGQNTGLENSAYTLMFKGETGINPEDLTLTQVNTILNQNCNLYLNYGNYYNWFRDGKMVNGYFFDQIINRDMLKNDIQLNITDVLNGSPKIPQTDQGQLQLIHVVNQACQKGVSRGYLAPGVFNPVNGLPLLTLRPGDAIPNGYIVLSDKFANQSSADRSARKAMPIYVVVCEAGAIHSVVVKVNVQI